MAGSHFTRIVLLCLSLFFTAVCFAENRYFIEGGAAVWNKQRNTVWYQEGYDYDQEYTSIYLRGGVIFPISERYAIRNFLFSLGRYSMDALATPNEDEYIQHGAYCAHCGDPDLYRTSGRMLGAGITGTVRLGRFTFEAGPTLVRQDWKLEAIGISPTSQYGMGGNYSYQGHLYGVGRVVGLEYEYDSWRLGAHMYSSNVGSGFNDGVFPAGTGKHILALSVGKTF